MLSDDIRPRPSLGDVITVVALGGDVEAPLVATKGEAPRNVLLCLWST